MDQTVPYHFVFAFESFASLATGAPHNRAIMWPGRRVYIGVGVQQVLSSKRLGVAPAEFADIGPNVCDALQRYRTYSVDAIMIRIICPGGGSRLLRTGSGR